MCFFRPKKYTFNERIKKNKVIPVKRSNTFSAELIPCGGCQQVFDLGSEELKIHCNLCNQFFHCNIAGACRGDDCQVIKHTGYRHRARYCIDCLSRVYKNNDCLCKECFIKEY